MARLIATCLSLLSVHSIGPRIQLNHASKTILRSAPPCLAVTFYGDGGCFLALELSPSQTPGFCSVRVLKTEPCHDHDHKSAMRNKSRSVWICRCHVCRFGMSQFRSSFSLSGHPLIPTRRGQPSLYVILMVVAGVCIPCRASSCDCQDGHTTTTHSILRTIVFVEILHNGAWRM